MSGQGHEVKNEIKAAQQKNKAAMLDDFAIGFHRNDDYSTDRGRISSRYSRGDKISVKCKSVSSDAVGHINWEAVTKYHRTTPVVCDVTEGAVTIGRIVGIRDFAQAQGVFVRLTHNSDLDVLCSAPNFEIEKNINVVVRIMRIEPGKNEFTPPRIRGQILAVAQG